MGTYPARHRRRVDRGRLNPCQAYSWQSPAKAQRNAEKRKADDDGVAVGHLLAFDSYSAISSM